MDIKRMFFRNKPTLDEVQQPRQSPVPKPPAEATLEDRIIAAMRTVYDPEIHINIYDLGLIYNIEIDAMAKVTIDMTLTAPACPVAEILPEQVANVVREVSGVNDVRVEMVWEPPWSQDAISEAAKLELGLL